MIDTPQHIKELQLQIWISKSPAERLKQFMEDNASLFQFWSVIRNSNHTLEEKTDIKKAPKSNNK